MTAPALNPAQFVTPPASGAGAGAASAPGDAAGAFEALMTALFPQVQAPPSATGVAAPAKDLLADADAKTGASGQEEAEAAALAPEGEDAAGALAASLQGAQLATAQPAAAAAKNAAATAPAWGRDKATGAPAQPALLHANAKADLAGKFEATAEDGGEASPHADGDQPSPQSAAQLPPQASAQARAATQVPAAAPPPQASTAADADAPAPPQAPSPEAETSAPTAPPAAATAQAAVSLAARPEAAQVQPVRPGKGEQRRSDAEGPATSDLKPREASDKPNPAKAAQAAAKLASAAVEGVEPKAAETGSDSDAPDTVQGAESRATGQSSAATAQMAQVVRGSPETVAALAAQIIKKLDGRSTRFDVELDPAGLGKVDVRVEIGAHGRMVASLTFENPQAAQDLKARSGDLQRALEQAGFDLSGGLSFDAAGDRGRQGQAWQEQADAGSAFQGRAFRQALDTAGDADAAATQGALRLRRGVSAGLDLRI